MIFIFLCFFVFLSSLTKYIKLVTFLYQGFAPLDLYRENAASSVHILDGRKLENMISTVALPRKELGSTRNSNKHITALQPLICTPFALQYLQHQYYRHLRDNAQRIRQEERVLG